jgi:hypothetical protein
MNYFSIWDVFFVPLLVILAWVIAIKIEHKHVNNSAYRYYHWGLLYKIAGALALCGIYIFYYGGGDTTGYFNSAMAMRNLFFQDTGTYLSILSNNLSPENLSVFNNSTC